MGLECLFDFLCILFGDSFLEYLWHRLDKLLRLHITTIHHTRSAGKKGENKEVGGGEAQAHLDEGEIRHEGLDLLDDLWLGTRVERLEPHVEYRLFLRLGRFLSCRLVCVDPRGACCSPRRSGSARRGQCNFLDVETRLK